MGGINKLHKFVQAAFDEAAVKVAAETVDFVAAKTLPNLGSMTENEIRSELHSFILDSIMRHANYGDIANQPAVPADQLLLSGAVPGAPVPAP